MRQMATHPATLDPDRNDLAGQTLMRQVTIASSPRWMRDVGTDPAQRLFPQSSGHCDPVQPEQDVCHCHYPIDLYRFFLDLRNLAGLLLRSLKIAHCRRRALAGSD